MRYIGGISVLHSLTVAFLVILAEHDIAADTIYVALNGNDAGTGKYFSPYKTIAKGIGSSVAGDIVFLKNGLYRERVTFSKSGEAGKPIVLTGEKGTIIDGGTLITGWQKVSTYGGNIYRIPYTGSKPYNLIWNNKYILRIRDEFMVIPGMDTTLRYGPKGWDTYEGPPYRSWDGVQAMWGTYQNYIYIGFGDPGVDPNNSEISYTPSENNGGATITLTGSHYVNIRGLTIRNGYNGIYVRSNSSECIIENDSISGGRYGIFIASGSSRIIVRKNKITLGYVHSLDPDNPRHWFIWAAFKKNSDYDRICVSVDNVGPDIDIAENHMFENFDGVENTGTSLRLLVRDNFIENLADDGLEPCGEETDARWCGNTVKQCNIAYRHKEITGNGPMYIYRNKFYSRPGTVYAEKLGIYLYSGETTTAYFYHNTIVTALGFSFGSTNVAPGLPNLWMVNNLFSCTKIFNENSSWTKKPHFDYNYVGGNLSYQASWWGSHNKISYLGQIWNLDSIPDFLLKSDSPARETGIDISKSWTVQNLENPSLTGYTSDYFSGVRPDAGFHQFGKTYTGIADHTMPEILSVKAYPNPFSDMLTLKISSVIPGNLRIQLCDFQGNLVYQNLINTGTSNEIVIKLEGHKLKSGLYLLSVYHSDKYISCNKLLHL
jgi:hypothetical protein